MTEIHGRLRMVRDSLKISQKEFAQRIFISQSLYADIEKGNIVPKERFLRLISFQYNVSLDWIKTGNGDMFTSPPPDVRLEHLINMFNQLSPELQDCVLDHLKRLLKIQNEKKM